jgi:hypothetical protein
MKLTGSIYETEKKYLKPLEDFFVRTWGETLLWSHNIDHHKRVWKYAREILETVFDSSTSYSQISPENLIVACYLHDLGMSADPGAEHGILSSRLCKKFLTENNLSESQFAESLSAIENHDNKKTSYASSQNQTLKILTAADDLDSFGFVGIYRFYEIYTIRGVPTDEIGYTIRRNAGLRFANFKAAFSPFRELVRRHTERYHVLDDFYKGFNAQLPERHNVAETRTDFSDVLNLFSEIIKGKRTTNKISNHSTGHHYNSLTEWYISGFLSGLANN